MISLCDHVLFSQHAAHSEGHVSDGPHLLPHGQPDVHPGDRELRLHHGRHGVRMEGGGQVSHRQSRREPGRVLCGGLQAEAGAGGAHQRQLQPAVRRHPV